MVDSRLVQTAVLGSAQSFEPVILPTDHYDLDAFRGHYINARFWCGELLGGCGRELTTKRYVDRSCHFAHIADLEQGPSACSRGAHSADHLYVHREVGAWLRSQGYGADGVLLGEQHAEAVDFVLRETRLRVQLAPVTAERWAIDNTQARLDGLPISAWLIANSEEAEDASFDAGNPALQVRLQTAGTEALPERRVEVGTRSEDGGTDWDRLRDCTLADNGRIQTPALRATGRRSPARRRPPAIIAEQAPAPIWTPPAPRPRNRIAAARVAAFESDEAQRAALLREAASVASHLGFECRANPLNISYVADVLLPKAVELNTRVREAGGGDELAVAIERARTKLDAAIQADEEERARARQEAAARAKAHEEAQAKYAEKLRKAVRRDQDRLAAKSSDPGQSDEHPSSAEVAQLSQAARLVFEHYARAKERITWRRVCEGIKRPDLLSAPPEFRHRILRLVDSKQTFGQHPLLCSLLYESDPPRNTDSFVRIAREHGRDVPDNPTKRSRMLHDEVSAVFAHWDAISSAT